MVSIVRIGILAALLWLGTAGGSFGEHVHVSGISEETGGLGLLGIAAQPGGAEAGPSTASTPDRSRWSRLPEDVRRELFRVIRRQLDHPGRSDETPRPINVAASQHGESVEMANAYQEWLRSGADRDTWPRYYFDHGLGEEGRRLLLSLHAKLKSEHIWERIETFDRFDPRHAARAAAWVMPLDGDQDLRDRLESLGYGPDQIDTRAPRWAVRSPRTGAQLHIIGPTGDPRFVEVHIDIANPGRMVVEPTVGSILSSPIREVAYGCRALRHGKRDLLLEGSDEFGPLTERVADRVKAAVTRQGIHVPDVDEDAYGSVVLSDTVKWKTDPGSFGWLWLRPQDRRAGWWTGADGPRDFTRVEYLASGPSPAPPRFVLTYEAGWAEISVTPDGRLSGRWFSGTGMTSSGRPTHVEFHGELVGGSVRRATP
jgi:hypothetical protein